MAREGPAILPSLASANHADLAAAIREPFEPAVRQLFAAPEKSICLAD
jgi:hypothetical protein